MIRSMTGYSRVEAEEAGFALSVGIRSTNHRFLDPQLRLPSSLEALEAVVRGLLKEHVSRNSPIPFKDTISGTNFNLPILQNNNYISFWKNSGFITLYSETVF